MSSQYITPIVFKSTGSFERNYPLEWKKQVATTSLKKGMSLTDYILSKYKTKIEQLFDNSKLTLLLTFKFNEKSEFIIFGYKNMNKSIITFLHYNLHLPCSDDIILND